MKYPYVFPPLSLMGPVLRFLKFHGRSCTVIALDVYPRKYWWPFIKSCATKSCRLAVKGEVGVLLLPSRQGWIQPSASETLEKVRGFPCCYFVKSQRGSGFRCINTEQKSCCNMPEKVLLRLFAIYKTFLFTFRFAV